MHTFGSLLILLQAVIATIKKKYLYTQMFPCFSYLSNRYCFPHFFFSFSHMNTRAHTQNIIYYLFSKWRKKKLCVCESTVSEIYLVFWLCNILSLNKWIQYMLSICNMSKWKLWIHFGYEHFFFIWKMIFLWIISGGEGHVIKNLIKTNIPSSSSSFICMGTLDCLLPRR